MNVIKYLSAIVALALTGTTFAQGVEITKDEWKTPNIPSINKEQPRSGIMSFLLRDDAEKHKTTDKHFISLEGIKSMEGENCTYYGQEFEVPTNWLDRAIYLRATGLDSYYVIVNDKYAAFGSDARGVSEFLLNDYLTDGRNSVVLQAMKRPAAAVIEWGSHNNAPAKVEAYIFTQPKAHILDYSVRTELDSTGKNGIYEIEVVVKNNYNAAEEVTVGYDIYNPEGKLAYYDIRDCTPEGKGTDTLRFKESLGSAAKYQWSAENPHLYKVMIFIKRGGQITEYVPLKIGFGKTELIDGKLWRSGKALNLTYGKVDQTLGRKDMTAALKALKSKKYNGVALDYPMGDWFYRLCDEVGIYVVEQANINCPVASNSRKTGGSPSNDPRWERAYTERVESIYMRHRNHPCVIAWSIGGASGNGYPMYRAYQWLKAYGDSRPVIYRDAGGEWNSDMEYPFVK